MMKSLQWIYIQCCKDLEVIIALLLSDFSLLDIKETLQN